MIKVDTINLIIEEFLEKEKFTSNNVEVQIPLELPLEIPYWPEPVKDLDRNDDYNEEEAPVYDIPFTKIESDKKDKNNNIYEGKDVIIFEMNSLY